MSATIATTEVATSQAVAFIYTPDCKGERTRQPLKPFAGTLQADGYTVFHHLYDSETIVEASCWALIRHKACR